MSILLWLLIDMAALGIGPPLTEPELPSVANGHEVVQVLEVPEPGEPGVWRCLSNGYVMVYGGPPIPGLTDGPDCVPEVQVVNGG
jgi:hypothetical protein